MRCALPPRQEASNMAFPRVSVSLIAASDIPTITTQATGLMVLSDWFASNRLQERIAPRISRSQWERTFGALGGVTTLWDLTLRAVSARSGVFSCCDECCIDKLLSTLPKLCELALPRQRS